MSPVSNVDVSHFIIETCIEYITGWTAQFDHIMIFAWCALKKLPKWEDIEASVTFMTSKNRFDRTHETELFDQLTYLKQYVTSEKIAMWTEKETPTDARWVECFQHFREQNIRYEHVKTIVSYILCLPGTSASVERIFSLINDIWTTEKTRMLLSTLKDIVFVRYNIKMSCLGFFNFLKSQPQMIKAIGTEGKYAFKKKREDDDEN